MDTSAVGESVVAGVLEHRSQLHVLLPVGVDRRRLARMVGRESYTLEWPPPEGPGLLADLFEGLAGRPGAVGPG